MNLLIVGDLLLELGQRIFLVPDKGDDLVGRISGQLLGQSELIFVTSEIGQKCVRIILMGIDY